MAMKDEDYLKALRMCGQRIRMTAMNAAIMLDGTVIV
jgi:hypothetical protein